MLATSGMMQICLDSSILVKLLVQEDDSDQAEELLRMVLQAPAIAVAPDFAWAEVGSAIRRRVRQRQISPEAARDAWTDFRDLPLAFLGAEATADRAWALAEQWGLPTLYDAAFLAAGEGTGFWTADQRLLADLGDDRPAWVHHLHEPFRLPG